jgi:glycosyltransferase involved in cell wall biosynthesis
MPEQTLPDISVVIPCYNAARWVSRAIESVLAQTGVAVEVIVIDDGSTDESLDAIKRHAERIRWKTGPNRGACTARNRGLALASAKYVMFLDADDYIEGPFLPSLVSTLEKGGAQICIGQVVDASEHTTPHLRKTPDTTSWRSLLLDWLNDAFIPPCGILWSTEYVRGIGGWNERLSKNQDGEIIFRAAADKAAFASCKKGRAIYWHHNSQTRISGTVNSKKLMDNLSVQIWLYRTLKERDMLDNNLIKILSRTTHKLERIAVRNNLEKELADIRFFRNSQRWPRAEGKLLHKAAVYTVGLHAKENVTKIIRRFFQQEIHR